MLTFLFSFHIRNVRIYDSDRTFASDKKGRKSERQEEEEERCAHRET